MYPYGKFLQSKLSTHSFPHLSFEANKSEYDDREQGAYRVIFSARFVQVFSLLEASRKCKAGQCKQLLLTVQDLVISKGFSCILNCGVEKLLSCLRRGTYYNSNHLSMASRRTCCNLKLNINAFKNIFSRKLKINDSEGKSTERFLLKIHLFKEPLTLVHFKESRHFLLPNPLCLCK